MKKLVAFVTSTVSLTILLSAQQTPVFLARTDIVELDVSVLDKNRHPVRGLTAADFTVFEDGKPQKIAIFEAIDVPDPEPPPAAWMRDVTPDVATNEKRTSRLWAIVLDDALIPQEPWSIQASKQIVREIVDRFGPEDLATIVFTADSRQAQDFTNDRTKLLAILDKYSPGNASWSGPPKGSLVYVDPDWQFQTGSVLTLRSVMDALVLVPHTRKALIWVSPGVPHDFLIAPSEVPRSPGPTMHRATVQARIVELAKEVFELGRRANVPVYPIDPCGLGGLNSYASLRGGSAGGATTFLETTAAQTGGHAIINTNEFTPGIDRVFEENKSYYLIGYNPANTRTDGSYRRLDVKVNRDDVDVRTRSSYYAPKPGDNPPKSTGAMLTGAIAKPVAISELPLRVAVAPFAIATRDRIAAAVTIAVGVRQPVPDAAAASRVSVTTDLRVSAFNTEGDLKGTQQHKAKVTLRAGARGDADYEALSRIDLPPGRYRLRLAAFHELAAKTGTVMVDVIVPDFARDPSSMSGVVLNASPGRPSAPRDLFKAVLPVIPTAQRVFLPEDRVTALFYIYQNGLKALLPADLTTTITDGRGDVRVSDTQQIPVARFVGSVESVADNPTRGPQTIRPLRAAEVQFRLPLERLPAGPYLITFEAKVGLTVLRRDVQFQVK